ncbi:MAG: N-acetyl sugar amidotransferase [Elusimicrobia bacterium]|nr:N-acetyl sugar amidotransferase [Elusimicrobiota bacterium]
MTVGAGQSALEKSEAYWGLPSKVRYCRRCVFSNQRPLSTNEYLHTTQSRKDTLAFDDQGVCLACRQMDKVMNEIDWQAREKELIEFLDQYRSKDGSYDVLVPGSGGKDSAMAAHLLKYRYGMHPLTVTWAPHLYTDIGWKNFQNWIHQGGFDNYLFTPNGRVHRILTRLAVTNLFHPFQPFIVGQKSFPLKMAIKFNIKLIFYGEMPAQYGDAGSVNEKKFGGATASAGYQLAVADNRQLSLGGVSVEELKKSYGLSDMDLSVYLPLEPSKAQAFDGEFHYLGYYVKWIPQEAYYYAVENTGFQANPERSEGTYSKYNSLDDKIDGFHFWTTYVKYGIGRATYEASQEVRNRHITREEAVALVRRFDGEFPKRYFKEILDYLSLTEEEFFAVADRFRSPHLWKQDNDGWKLRHPIWDEDKEPA